MKAILLILLCLCASLILAQNYNDGYISVVSRLSQFQTKTGGFKLTEADTTPSVSATADAIFLSSLYGLRQQISPQTIEKYLSTLANEHDAGYGKSAGIASDVDSLKDAVFSYVHLGRTAPVSPVKYVKNLIDKESHLFARVAQGKADLVATATALQVLDNSREIGKPWVQDLVPFLKSFLDSHKASASEGAYFSFPNSQLSVVSANYYGIVIGSLIGYDFSSSFSKFIAAQQAKNGGFYADLQKTQLSIESTAHAVLSLSSLNKGEVINSDYINTDALFAFLYQNTPRDLHSAALAHSAVAVTNNFRRNFNFTASYDVLQSNAAVDRRVVQGTHIKPVLNIRTIFGHPHAGLDVTVQSKDPVGKTNTYKLKFREPFKYSSDEFIDTSNQLGSLSFRYIVKVVASGLPSQASPQFEVVDVKRVGYGMTVKSSAVSDVAGRSFAIGEQVAIGTQFSFSLDLNNLTHERFPSKGDVDVIFNVLDSSNVIIHESRQAVRTDNTFTYTLTNSDLPAGALAFRFQVGSGSNIHTEEVVEYQLNAPMIATKITFENFAQNQAPAYKIGDVVRVSMEPAAYPDLRTQYPLSSQDANGKFVADKRHFYLDVKSSNGVTIKSVLGKVSKKNGNSYGFEVPVDATLDYIGTNAVSFRYVAANGNSFNVANFDSQFDEVFEDNNVLNYTIQSQLQVVDIEEQPKSEDYFYGNEIVFKFRVKDAVSGQYITRGSSEKANVYLTLTHNDENKGKPFTSAVEAAKQVGDQFVIQWPINPNAVQGSGVLNVNAQDVDGNNLQLYKSGSSEAMSHDVNITGKIEVQENTYSTSVLGQERTAFVVGFNLSCKSRSLRDAQLRATVVLQGSTPRTLASGLPVATNNEGKYSVSWTAPLSQTPTGRYTLNFYREVDRRRALDNREFRERQARREVEMRRRAEMGNDVEFVEEGLSEEGIENELTPLFSISLNHESPSVSKSPIRLEVIVLTALVGAFFAVSYQKKHYITNSLRF